MAQQISMALSNGMGGIDWAGLPLFVALHDVHDVEGLVDRMLTIKHYRAPT
jgi:hypothetical protein